MVFIDFQNFNIATQDYLFHNNQELFTVDYIELSKRLVDAIHIPAELVKTYLFAYKPCDQLMTIEYYRKYYNWLNGLKSQNYFEIVEGSQEVRSINPQTPIDMQNKFSYTTVEKGTDVNIAVHMLSKAYSNAYDVAILVSGDTDYIPIVKVLHQLGKVVVIAHLPQQNVSKYDEFKDAYVKISIKLLQECRVQKRSVL